MTDYAQATDEERTVEISERLALSRIPAFWQCTNCWKQFDSATTSHPMHSAHCTADKCQANCPIECGPVIPIDAVYEAPQDDIEYLLNRLAAAEKENADLRAKLDQAVGLLREVLIDHDNRVSSYGKASQCQPNRHSIMEGIRAYLATLSDKGEQ